jgi:hypothetical protein
MSAVDFVTRAAETTAIPPTATGSLSGDSPASTAHCSQSAAGTPPSASADDAEWQVQLAVTDELFSSHALSIPPTPTRVRIDSWVAQMAAADDWIIKEQEALNLLLEQQKQAKINQVAEQKAREQDAMTASWIEQEQRRVQEITVLRQQAKEQVAARERVQHELARTGKEAEFVDPRDEWRRKHEAPDAATAQRRVQEALRQMDLERAAAPSDAGEGECAIS